jgi:glycosyltransferase involved in cell wall biosynthesis
VLHVISGLMTGGAERALCSIVNALGEYQVESSVLTLHDGPLRLELQDMGVPTVVVNPRNPIAMASCYWRARKMPGRLRPALVHGWMYHGNLVALGIAAAFGMPSVWGIRQGVNDARHEKFLTRLVIRASAALSGRVTSIVYNSGASRRMHSEYGFADRAGSVIFNGFDTSRYRPRPELGSVIRAEIGVPDDAFLIGHVARFHSIKNHDMFVRAVRQVQDDNSRAWAVMIGRGVEWTNSRLSQLVGNTGRFTLLGERHDLDRLYAAMDVCCVSSWSESFPNVIGEAMACGVPCIATDVGAAESLIGQAGLLVPPGDVAAMAAAIGTFQAEDEMARKKRRDACRMRIIEGFSIRDCASRFRGLYDDVLRIGASADITGVR